MKKLTKEMASILLLSVMSVLLLASIPTTQLKAEAATLNNLQAGCNEETTTWEYIYFGNYWQNDTNGDGEVNMSDSKEPIVWRVLSTSGNKVILLAEQNLDARTYHDSEVDIDWADCQLRTWLNESFYMNAFTDAERAAIQTSTIVTKGDSFLGTQDVTTTDKIYIPSLEDISNCNYGFLATNGYDDNRTATNTNYTATKPNMYAGGTPDVYWLRNVGQYSNIMTVLTNGIWDYHTKPDYVCGVRPMLELDISNTDLWNVGSNKVVDEERNLMISGQENYDYAYQVLDILNETRAAVGENALTMDEELLETAMQRAAEISLYYSHTRPNGQDCFSAFRLNNVCQVSRAENIAVNQSTPEEVMNDWNNSSGHYANIINSRYQSVGIGCFVDSNGMCYWVQCFDSAAWKKPEKTTGIEEVTRNISISDSHIFLTTDKYIEIGCDEQPTELTMRIKNVNAKFSYSEPELSTSNFEYSSSNPAVAEVDENGVITFKTVGTVVVTAVLKENPAKKVSQTITKKDHLYTSEITTPEKTEANTEQIATEVTQGENEQNEEKETVQVSVKQPGKITGLSIKNKKSKKIDITWKKQKDVDGYQIQLATKKNFKKGKKTKSVYANKLTWGGLKKGKTYYVRVRAYQYDEDFNKVYGAWSGVKKVKVRK